MVIGERDVIIISDRHQGIIRSVLEVFGSENHAHCYRHIKENFSTIVKHYLVATFKINTIAT